MRIYPQLFSQRDPRWSTILINNTPGATIGLYGCLIISWEMKANYYGHLLTPPQLMNLLAQQKLFTNGDYISNDNDLSIVFPDILYLQTLNYQDIPADLDTLVKLSDDETLTITLELDFDHNPSDGIQTHFVELHQCIKNVDGSFSLQLYDPWDGQDKLFSETYGNDPKATILKCIVYKGTPAIEGKTTNANTLPVASDDFRRLVSKSTNADTIGGYFGLSANDMADPLAGQKVVSKIKDLVTELKNAQSQLIQLPHDPVPTVPIVDGTGTQSVPTMTTPTPSSLPASSIDQLKGSNGAENQAISDAITMSKSDLPWWKKLGKAIHLLLPFD